MTFVLCQNLPVEGSAVTGYAHPVPKWPSSSCKGPVGGRHSRVRCRTSIHFVVELSYWIPTRRLKRSRAPNLVVHPAQADPAPFGKCAALCFWGATGRRGGVSGVRQGAAHVSLLDHGRTAPDRTRYQRYPHVSYAVCMVPGKTLRSDRMLAHMGRVTA